MQLFTDINNSLSSEISQYINDYFKLFYYYAADFHESDSLF